MWFKVDHCLPFMSFDATVYYLYLNNGHGRSLKEQIFIHMTNSVSLTFNILCIYREKRIRRQQLSTKHRNLVISETLLHQWYPFHKLFNTFTKCIIAIMIFSIDTIIHVEISSDLIVPSKLKFVYLIKLIITKCRKTHNLLKFASRTSL